MDVVLQMPAPGEHCVRDHVEMWEHWRCARRCSTAVDLPILTSPGMREFCKMYRSPWDGVSPGSAARFFMVVARFRMRTRAFGLNQEPTGGLAALSSSSRASAGCVHRGSGAASTLSKVTVLSSWP